MISAFVRSPYQARRQRALISLLLFLWAPAVAVAPFLCAHAGDGANASVASEKTDIDTWLAQQVKVCAAKELSLCLAQLPRSWQQALPSIDEMLASFGWHGAMSISVSLPPSTQGTSTFQQDVGLILLAPHNIPSEVSTYCRGRYWQLPLTEQALMSEWHEIGHLLVEKMQNEGLLPEALAFAPHASLSQQEAVQHEVTQYEATQHEAVQHETLADIYSIWRSVQHVGDLRLGWQQYHRRNLALLNSRANASHWSVPVLHGLLTEVPLSAWQNPSFIGFMRFIDSEASNWRLPPRAELSELQSLISQSFAPHKGPVLSQYLWWRREQAWRLLSPTFAHFLSADELQQWQQEFKEFIH
ncbi:MAG: hypothetical protein ACRCT7_10100 [Shewanella sp.]